VYPRIQPGDIVYIKEPFGFIDLDTGNALAGSPIPTEKDKDRYQVIYKYSMSDFEESFLPKIWASRFMPKFAARLWYPITGVGAGQVQEISWSDVMAEGVDFMGALPHPLSVPRLNKKKIEKLFTLTAQREFSKTWDSLKKVMGMPLSGLGGEKSIGFIKVYDSVEDILHENPDCPQDKIFKVKKAAGRELDGREHNETGW